MSDFEQNLERSLDALVAVTRDLALEDAAGIARDFLRSEMVSGGPYWALRVYEAIREAKGTP